MTTLHASSGRAWLRLVESVDDLKLRDLTHWDLNQNSKILLNGFWILENEIEDTNWVPEAAKLKKMLKVNTRFCMFM